MAANTLQIVINAVTKGANDVKDFATKIPGWFNKSRDSVGKFNKSAAESRQILGRVANEFKKTTRETNAFNRSLAGSSKALSEIKRLFGAYLGFQAVKSGIRTMADFDDVMRQVAAVAGANAEQMARMTAVAKEMGATTRYTASQAAEGLKFLAMAGFDAEKAMAALPGVLELAAAGNMDLGLAPDIATNVLTGFRLEVKDLGRVNDVMVKTFTSTNSTLVELGEAFSYVAPLAAGVGSDFEDTAAALGLLHNAGIKGERAGTALRGALSALINPTAEEAALMEKLSARIGGAGLKIFDSKGRFVGFTEIVRQLQKAGITAAEAMALFGARAGPGMAALIGTGSEALGELTDKLKKSQGTASRIAKLMEEGLGGSFRALKSAFEGLVLTIGAKIMPALKALIDGLTFLIRGITEVDTPTKILLATLLGAGVAFAMWRLGLGQLVGLLQIARIRLIEATVAANGFSMALKGGIVAAVVYGAIEIVRLGKIIYDWRKQEAENQKTAQRSAAVAEQYKHAITDEHRARLAALKSKIESGQATAEERAEYRKLLKDSIMYTGSKAAEAEALQKSRGEIEALATEQAGYIKDLHAAADGSRKLADGLKAQAKAAPVAADEIERLRGAIKELDKSYADQRAKLPELYDLAAEHVKRATTDEEKGAAAVVKVNEQKLAALLALSDQERTAALALIRKRVKNESQAAEEIARVEADLSEKKKGYYRDALKVLESSLDQAISKEKEYS